MRLDFAAARPEKTSVRRTFSSRENLRRSPLQPDARLLMPIHDEVCPICDSRRVPPRFTAERGRPPPQNYPLTSPRTRQLAQLTWGSLQMSEETLVAEEVGEAEEAEEAEEVEEAEEAEEKLKKPKKLEKLKKS